MNKENSRTYSKDWEKDPFNDIDLRGNLRFELPKAGENEEKNLKVQYVWHEDEVKIKKSFLTVKCQNCAKSTRCELDRDIIMMSNNFTNNDYHLFYCGHCSYGGKKDTRFRINRELTKVKFDVFNITQKVTLHRKYRPIRSIPVHYSPIQTDNHYRSWSSMVDYYLWRYQNLVKKGLLEEALEKLKLTNEEAEDSFITQKMKNKIERRMVAVHIKLINEKILTIINEIEKKKKVKKKKIKRDFQVCLNIASNIKAEKRRKAQIDRILDLYQISCKRKKG